MPGTVATNVSMLVVTMWKKKPLMCIITVVYDNFSAVICFCQVLECWKNNTLINNIVESKEEDDLEGLDVPFFLHMDYFDDEFKIYFGFKKRYITASNKLSNTICSLDCQEVPGIHKKYKSFK